MSKRNFYFEMEGVSLFDQWEHLDLVVLESYVIRQGSWSLRATSNTRLRARDHYTSSTLIGGKAGPGPSSLLHTTLEGQME